ncbi:IclR family transcriptional regulator [Citricoccus sp. SGAir0253]|uniref:IclR family transcriptional regulator n=1 Tax=Citricoccus sp. SGAir0253 TaxID=2567881 RepID=UPI0010CCDD43|nr:IclR family transcriptional regulator [Citricoccus sp. SGAir0253]QCU78894.1 IclR family transcriptional regulator [Citricoccus sp. SGAir0253]
MTDPDARASFPDGPPDQLRPGGDRRTAARRVLSVLDAFDQDHLELTLSAIGRRAGLTLSTTHRLVGELREWGALERLPDGRYTIGLRVLELGTLEPQVLHLQEVAPPFLADLQAAVDANVHLSVRDHHDVVYVESLQRRRGAHVLSRLGGRWPLHATATGMVLLAFAPPEVRDEVLSLPLKRYTDRTITDPGVLRQMLAEVRHRGFAVLHDSITTGASAVGVPVRGPRDREVAALSVTVPRDGPLGVPHVLPALVASARALSRELGAPSALRAGRTGLGPRTGVA